MKKRKYFCVAVFFVLIIFNSAIPAQNGNNNSQRFIVSTKWLAKHLNDKNLVLIEIGDKKDYKKRHIPGAVYLTRKDISIKDENGLILQIPPMKKLINSFENAGVSNNSRIILYYGNDWITPTARFYLTLDYMGLGKNTSILDGGLPQWQKESRPVTPELPKIKKGEIIVKNPNKNAIVDINYVVKNLNNPDYQIVDARTQDFYSGANKEYTRPGHIPGSTNIPFPSITTENPPYLIKSKKELKKIFADANVNGSKNIICYCHIGQQASLIYFIAKYLGYNNVHLYDGSYQEWDKRNDLPVMGAVKRKSN